MEKKFEIQNMYTERTFQEFAAFHCKRIQGIIYLKYLGFFILIYTVYSYMKLGSFNLQSFFFNPSFWFALIFIFMPYKITENSAKKLYLSCVKNQGLENTVTFYEKQVKIVSPQMEEAYFYGDVDKCYETDAYFYLYVRKSVAQILEKEKFTLGDLGRFRSFLKDEAKIKCISYNNEHKKAS